jgi:hypothetical protein
MGLAGQDWQFGRAEELQFFKKVHFLPFLLSFGS